MPSKRQREEYFVEVIMKARRTKHAALPGKDFLNSRAWEYLIKWAGYDDKDNTWEPVTELSACRRLITSFWEDVGGDSYLTNKKGFEVPPSEQWIMREKLYFASQTPLDEVREQNLNPKRRHSAPSSPAISPGKHNGKRKPSAPSSPSILSTPRARPTGSPRKVSFAPSANARIFTSSAENTAQFDRMTQQHTYEPSSDSEDDRPIAASLNFGIPALPVDTPPRTPERSESTAEMPPETPASQPCTPPSSTSDPLFSPPPTPPRRCIQMYDPPITPSSKLATKQRLAKTSVAPDIPRASSDSKAMDIDTPGPTPTLVPNENMSTPADVDDPMLSPMLMGEDNIDSASTGFYEANEDPYASLRTNTPDPFENSEYYDTNPVSSSEAMDFLSTVELPPVHRSSSPDYRPSRPIHEPAPMQKWAWHGQLSVYVKDQIEASETICEKAVITDSTECMPPRISAFVPSATPLQLAACYDIADLFVFLDVCKPPHQFARLVADGADAERLEIFGKYLDKKTQAGMLPTLWDGRLNGVLLFVSPTSRPLLEYLKTPPELCSNTGLVVILLYTQDPPPIDQHYKRLDLLPLQRTVEPAVLSPKQWRKSLLTERDYHVSLRIIQVPPAMRKYAYNHTSTVWSKCTSEGDDHRAGQDTRHLRRVLKKSKVGVVPATDSSADIVFIHVGALQNVHNLPHLARRRLRPEVRFCLYGSHETVSPSLWGFREIYLLGGIVTFTPEALVNDTWSVFKTIRNLHAHPLWVCYLLPQVVGMAVKLSQLREDEMPEYADVLPHLLNKIVTAVQKGEVGLMTTPSPHPTDKECGRWVLDNALLRPRTTETILNHCLKEFEDNYASHPQDTWSTLAKNDILADVRRLQIQPAALNNYRRFVILDSCDELRYHLSDGIEWNTVGTFDFHDDFVKALEKLSIA